MSALHYSATRNPHQQSETDTFPIPHSIQSAIRNPQSEIDTFPIPHSIQSAIRNPQSEIDTFRIPHSPFPSVNTIKA
ncbi:MAG TPA: hypothetical protein VGQ81_04465 [Acidobacteriota bacterium]|nr:hypothetical protein [Acidobacteriota bacterium]